MKASIAGPLQTGLRSGLERGWKGFLWMARIVVPISLVTSVLAWSGLLQKASVFLEPVMKLLGLPGIAAMPIMVGWATGIYGGIAAMTSLPLSVPQMSLVAVLLLMAHNLILEGIVQGRSGINGFLVTAFRIGTALATTFLCSLFIGGGEAGTAVADISSLSAATGSLSTLKDSLMPFLESWVISTLTLVAKILVIVFALMILLELLEAFGWMGAVVKALRPVLRILGLGEEAGYLWTAAAVFGLAYCAPLIVEEAGAGNLSRPELSKIHLSISINHSVVEDPLLFLALGIGAFWVYVPRLVVAILAVRLLSLRGRAARRRA